MECRICYSKNLKEVFTLKNVPESAQLFLKSKNEKYDCSINLSIKQCRNCGHVQSINKPVKYYKEVITAAGLSKNIQEERLIKIKEIINSNSIKKPRILEIGSHQGMMVEVIGQNINCSITGLEASEKSVKIAQNNNLNVIKGYFGEETKNLKNKKFDIVLCFNFLEHMPKPRIVLEEIKQYLTKNSYIYMTVPSLNFIESTSCIHEFISDHLSYFTKSSLRKLFSYCGFEIIRCEPLHNNNDLEIIAKFSSSEILSLDISKYEQLINKFNQLLEVVESKNHPLLIWGAGHRSLTFISQVNYEKINYIIDSAKFKQGKFSPVSRIEIVDPSILYKFQKGTLIINLPGIYGEEVISSLENEIKEKFNIYNIFENNIEEII